MRVSYAYLVLVDISGYTRFITNRSLALAHAEQIITDLISAVIDRSSYPMVLNKLEGDAALMYREMEPDDIAAGRDVLGQVRSFFPAFQARAEELRAMRSNCSCDACSNITSLTLKAFVHVGEIAIKQIRQFEELAGEPVILLHRLMKNQVPIREYVLLTASAARGARLDEATLRAHIEDVADIGSQQLWIAAPENLPELAGDSRPSTRAPFRAQKRNIFRHLPDAGRFGWLRRLRKWLKGSTQ
ncbi:MAG: DUF2652 domain-containing protein [Xanthomonadaceae bacterium]|nr:DUF2652 domain-containing protein [Xanthomonadaceae bacterium]